jgi:hypothetical protein
MMRSRNSLVALGLAAAVAVPFGTAEARGGASVGFSFGVPLGPTPYYYAPPPPAYYGPPPPVVYAPSPAYAPAPQIFAAPEQHCREYQSQSFVGGLPSTIYGTACLQPDGTWRIIR